MNLIFCRSNSWNLPLLFTWYSPALLVVRLLIAYQAVCTERVSTSQHLRVAVALEADHAL